jgi:hypothetical protein
MKQWIDELTYGNPSRDQVDALASSSEFDFLLPQIFKTEMPKNGSESTQDELKKLVEYQKDFTKLPQAVRDRFVSYDRDVISVVIDFINKRHNFDMEVLIKEMVTSTIPLIYKIKFNYQRPRPYQLAEHTKDSLFPLFSVSSDTPSFPSGHSFQMRIITNTIGSIHPTTYQDLQKLSFEVNEQRLYYGLHYPTDIDFGKYVADVLTTSKEWTTKYKI